MSRRAFVPVRNRRSVSLTALPRVGSETFNDALAGAVAEGDRILALFGLAETPESLRLIGIVANDVDGTLRVATTVVGDRYPSLTQRCPQAAAFERELAEQCGVIPDGHPTLRAVRRHPPDHRPAAWPVRGHSRAEVPLAEDERNANAEGHEVAVGPVHAGIIEPGHFRFQVHGEEILRLDVVLGYQHRGVERLLETTPGARAVIAAESIAGDSVIAHASAYCGALEALTRSHKSGRAQAIRGIALEIERLANHIGDLGALAGDVAYQPASAFFGRLRGECLNMLMTLSGNRFGRGLVRPGGVALDVPPAMATELAQRTHKLAKEVRPVAELFFGTGSVQSRLEGVGVVPRDACFAHGFVGPVARACEVPRDVRHDFPYGVFRYSQVPVATAWAGDVYARALVRWIEVQRSLEFVEEQLHALPVGEPMVPCGEIAPHELVVALEEGWRGEVVHVAVSGERGELRRHKVIDPSFRNWAALGVAMPGNEISDFPLCNKSFNLSYAGHDL